MESFHTPPGMCPSCGQFLDMTSGFHGDERPTPGAFTICIYCANILMFESGMRLRCAEEADIIHAPIDFVEALSEMVAAVKDMNKTRGIETRDTSRPN